jgi:hypothetical protein
MAILATLKIRNKRNGKTRIINEEDWANDLGVSRFAGWERVGSETHAADNEADVVEEAAKKALAAKRAEEDAKDAKDAAAVEDTTAVESAGVAEDEKTDTEAVGTSAEVEVQSEETVTEEPESETLFGENVARGIKID